MKPLTINVYLLTFTVLANTATPTKSMLHIEQLLRQHSCFVNSNDCHHDDVLWTENRWKIRGDSSFNIEGQAISGFVAAASSWIHPRSGWKRFTWQNRRVCPSSNGAICHMLSPAQYGGGEDDDEGSEKRRQWSGRASGEGGAGAEGDAEKRGRSPIPRMVSWGLTSRSPPSARKALGSSSKTHTTVHICEICGSEHVQWVGRCPTCKEWNSVKPFKVRREGSEMSRMTRPRASTGGSGRAPRSQGGEFEFAGVTGAGLGEAGWLPDEGFAVPTRISEVGEDVSKERLHLPGSELPRVFGGGLVPGSMIMIGGDPGVGKSTLLLQLAGQLSSLRVGQFFRNDERPTYDDGKSASEHQDQGAAGVFVEGEDCGEVNAMENESESGFYDPSAASEAASQRAGSVVYVSGEENNNQVASRAGRMGIGEVDLFLYCETDIDVIIDQVLDMQPSPALLMIDSIQTMRTADSTSSPGSIVQVKECASRLVRLAKGSGITVFIVGHVTKSGSIAGPKVVEHMVDTVLYLEGDRFNAYRLLRSVKNRFGPSNEIGVFEMTASGLEDVADPSMLFLSARHVDGGGDEEESMDGSAVCVYMEGSRPILCELQSLVTYSRLPSPRRTSDGLPVARLLLLLAVLQKRLGYDMSSREVYLNIVGGLRVQETAADLAVALAVVSSYTGIPVRSDTCFIGEIGLGGEVRQVQQLPRRIQEAEIFGFSRVVVPYTRKNQGVESSRTRRDGWTDPGRRSLPISAPAPTGVQDVDAFAHEKIRGRRGSIEVVECRNLKEAVAAGLTYVPTKRPRRASKRSSSGNSSRASGGTPRRGAGKDSDSDGVEFGWQQSRHEDNSGDYNDATDFSTESEDFERSGADEDWFERRNHRQDAPGDVFGVGDEVDEEDEDDGAESRWWYGVS